MTTASYMLLITLFLTEGGTLEAEGDTAAKTMTECTRQAREQEKILRQEFAQTREERGLCPFRDVRITCRKAKKTSR